MKIIFLVFALVQISLSSKSNWNQFWSLAFQSNEDTGNSLESIPEGLKISIKIESSNKIPADDEVNESDKILFEDFMNKFKKQYENEEEKQNRFQIFQENLRKIEMKNADPLNYATYGIDEFADRKTEEFGGCSLSVDDAVLSDSLLSNSTNMKSLAFDVKALPKSLDWRNNGLVSKVKNQGKCGSCWAFATTGMLESSYAMKYRKMVTFSEQQLVDCLGSCHGNNVYYALMYIKQAGGIVGDSSYPYQAVQYQCRFSRRNVIAQVNKIGLLNKDEDDMLQYVALYGPLASSVNAELLHQYRGGIIYSNNCPKQTTHAILIVGYGTTDKGVPYWLIKNSWGTNWGENGYFKLYRGANMCGIKEQPIYGDVL